MKKLMCFLFLFIFTFSSLAMAGAPRPGTEGVPVEKDVTEAAPPPPPPEPSVEPLVIKKFGTGGAGLGGNILSGTIEKDEIAQYPQTEYGFTCLLGFGTTWYNGQPSAEQIRAAAAAVKTKYGSLYGTKTFSELVREELGVTSLSYVQLGTALLIVPCNAEVGTVWLTSDTSRFRLGFGIPTLISFGWSWDI